MLADYHLHTSFSDDSEYEMEDCIKQGIKLGLDEMCFTEHIDYGVKTHSNCDMPEYFKEFTRCKQIFGDQINLRFGIEFGMQTGTVDEFKRTFDNYPFDFVILSCHQVDNKEFWNQVFQKGKAQNEYNERYYEEILKVLDMYHDYSVLGHLDMIKRYDLVGDYPYEHVKPLVEEILKKVIKAGKGIEVNTSCYRYGLNDLTPSTAILRQYKEFGGEIITIGSDSHKKEHLGYKIADTQKNLKNIGFEGIYTFEKMQPLMHSFINN